MFKKTPHKLIAGIGMLLVAMLIQKGLVQAQTPPSNAQGVSTTNVQKQIIQLNTPTVRTAEDMERDNARAINTTPRAIPFRPTIDPATYRRLKDRLNSPNVTPPSKESLDPSFNRDLTR
jgi:hypothetical protein